MKAGLLLMAGSALVLAAPSTAAERDQLGRAVKLTILVDKVMQPVKDWVTEEWMVREAAEAGFNVYSPRRGYNDLDAVRQVTEWCQKHGIYHMPWMRGTLNVPEDADAEGKRLLWASGVEQALWSPNSDEFWDWTSQYIVAYARISADNPHLMGVFLDYENYAAGKPGNCYSLSYDDIILGKFAEAQGIELPELEAAERKAWLEEQGLHEEFSQFQISHWRERCRALREAVDEHDPSFQFCIYPAPGTLFMVEACYPEWATEQAPLILADACTYGRPSGFLPHAEALNGNRRALAERMASAGEAGIPFIYAGGIDPVVRGADPEFCGKNAVMISEVTDGYWIFYEGPKYSVDHPDYFKWFTWANQAIAAGNFDAQHRPRETPDEWGLAKHEPQTDKAQLAIYGMKQRMFKQLEEHGKFEVHELRGNALEYLKGFDVILLQNFNVGLTFESELVRTLRAYVQAGGGLMLAHDTAWFMASPFPEIAARARPDPTHNVEAERHVVETDLHTIQRHPALGRLYPRMKFATEFRDHMIFNPGREGTVIIANAFGDPAYVVGRFREGRVVFSGCYYGYTNRLAGMEKKVLFSLLDWLVGE